MRAGVQSCFSTPTRFAPPDSQRRFNLEMRGRIKIHSSRNSFGFEQIESAALFVQGEFGERQQLVETKAPHRAFSGEIEQVRLDFVGEQ